MKRCCNIRLPFKRKRQQRFATSCSYRREVASVLLRNRSCSRGQKRSLRNATRIAPYSTDKRRRTRRGPPYETVHFPSARSQDHSSRIFARTRNRPKSDGSLPKRGRLLSFVQSRSATSPVSKVVWQPASLR